MSAPGAFSPATLAQELEQRIGRLAGKAVCVAYSGGLDSTVLLHALARLRRTHRVRLRAVHVNHHLHEAADRHAAAALREARRWRVPCKVLHAVVLPATDDSPEAAAREARYALLAAELAADEALLTAHHQDDQLETVMLALLRGSGVRGLSAMAAATPWHGRLLLRPLLGVSRGQIDSYAREQALGWSEDPTNSDERFERNYLRLRVLPLIRQRWSAAALTVSRSAALLGEARELLEQQACADLAHARDGAALRVSVLMRLPEARRRNALRQWIAEQSLVLPDHRRLREIAGRMLTARGDATPRVQWRGGEVRRHGDLLLALAGAAGSSSVREQSWDWRSQQRLALLGGGSLELTQDLHGDVLLPALPARLRVSYRRGGERLQGLAGRIALKDLMQTQGLAPWKRATVPLLGDGERIIAVADLWLDPDYRVGGSAAASREGEGLRGRFRWRTEAHADAGAH